MRGEAGASAWIRYRASAGRFRRERVTIRTAVAVSGGVAVAAMAFWWAGLATGAALFVVYAVYQRWHPESAMRWRRGALAERRTGRELLGLDPDEYAVLHDRELPGTSSNLDHVVVGPTGVHVVVTRPSAVDLGRAVDLAEYAGAVVRAELSAGLPEGLGGRVAVGALVVVRGRRVPRGGLDAGDVVVHRIGEAVAVIADGPVTLDREEVRATEEAVEHRFPPMRP